MTERYQIVNAETIATLQAMDAGSVDSIVQDPPAGIGFMGRSWDKKRGYQPVTDRGVYAKSTLGDLLKPEDLGFVLFMVDVATEELRVIKPGGHALTWALPRTADLTTLALRIAGWEVRDSIVHLFGQGFAKSLDVSKAIDKAAGAEREVIGKHANPAGNKGRLCGEDGGTGLNKSSLDITAPATEAAKEWAGWGTGLSPGHEQWILARKPMGSTVVACVLEHGTGAINVDGCRTPTSEKITTHSRGPTIAYAGIGSLPVQDHEHRAAGRWPKNAVLSCSLACEPDRHSPGCPVAELDAMSGQTRSGVVLSHHVTAARHNIAKGIERDRVGESRGHGDTGGASRFFPRFGYHPKASDRKVPGRDDITNKHPTHKHPELMRWLVRLVTPPGGLVLDPFMGSGTTGVATILEGASFVGIELDPDYCEVARCRVQAAASDPAYYARKRPRGKMPA